MFQKGSYINSHPTRKGWLFSFVILVIMGMFPLASFAHPSPNTLIFLDLSPGKVRMEVQMPVPELELAFGNDISKDPTKIIDRYGAQLKEYLLAHIHAYATKDRPWQIEVASLSIDKGIYVDTNIPYWEVKAIMTLTPNAGEDTRHFYLDYDAIMHQVANHAALVSIRSDWETGSFEQNDTEVQAISWDLQKNVVPPLEINAQKGNNWKGFASMVKLGTHHIADGTDHLMFLLVLLLPAPLIVRAKKWAEFGGIKYSIIRLLKIVTAFTVGHSLTLLLGSMGWVRLPAQPIEILIAISILVSAVHAIRPIFPGKEMFVAASFGLIHGLAFAATLSNLNLDTGPMVISILGFNVGIELMQLLIVALTMPWLIILSKTPFYQYLRIAGAVLASIAAVAWIIQRVTNQPNIITDAIENVGAHAKWIIFALSICALLSLIWTKSKKNVLQKA